VTASERDLRTLTGMASDDRAGLPGCTAASGRGA